MSGPIPGMSEATRKLLAERVEPYVWLADADPFGAQALALDLALSVLVLLGDVEIARRCRTARQHDSDADPNVVAYDDLFGDLWTEASA